ncbi:GNAT family protein [Streptosporangium longisporum]|uniref:GNAT family protein n=2 Tax=Streptosporangium longisporum TaxID=46187 RepID=A0ABP6LDD0_9ACTN
MLTPTYPIRTERLILRPYTPDDLDALHAIQRLPEVTRYLYWEPRTRTESEKSLHTKMAQTRLLEEGQTLTLAAELATTGQLVGDGMLHWYSSRHRGAELGYVLHPDHHGHGYATEIGHALLALGFDGLDLHRIIGRLDARNHASTRVLEKLGMRREAHLVDNEFVKGEWASELVYAILRREWHPRH